MVSDTTIKELRDQHRLLGEEIQSLKKRIEQKSEDYRALAKVIERFSGTSYSSALSIDTSNSVYVGDAASLMLPRKTKESIIVEFLQEQKQPMKSEDIRSELSDKGVEIKPTTFDALMSKLKREGRVEKPKYGHYQYKE